MVRDARRRSVDHLLDGAISMKRILLPVHGDEGQEARVRASLDVARVLGGHVECLDIGPLPSPRPEIAGAEEPGGLLVADDRPRSAVRRKQIARYFARDGVSWNWIEADGLPSKALAERADLADLIIVPSAKLEDRDDLRVLASKVSRKTGRLVLAIPPASSGIELRGTALVAWEGTHDADSALRGAVAFLRETSDVVLLEIYGHGSHSVASAQEYLAEHEIEPRVEQLRYDKDLPIVSAILERAHEINAGYVVIGAFHDSLATELVFGGVTRSMLGESDLPLLIGH